jgi:hypothetical protein
VIFPEKIGGRHAMLRRPLSMSDEYGTTRPRCGSVSPRTSALTEPKLLAGGVRLGGAHRLNAANHTEAVGSYTMVWRPRTQGRGVTTASGRAARSEIGEDHREDERVPHGTGGVL